MTTFIPLGKQVLGELVPDEIKDAVTGFTTKINRRDYRIIKVVKAAKNELEGNFYVIPRHAGIDLSENKDINEMLVSEDDLLSQVIFK